MTGVSREPDTVASVVIERLDGTAEAAETPIGNVPTVASIDRTGLDIDDDKMAKILAVDSDAWRGEVSLVEGHFDFIGERLPQEMRDELQNLEKRLSN